MSHLSSVHKWNRPEEEINGCGKDKKRIKWTVSRVRSVSSRQIMSSTLNRRHRHHCVIFTKQYTGWSIMLKWTMKNQWCRLLLCQSDSFQYEELAPFKYRSLLLVKQMKKITWDQVNEAIFRRGWMGESSVAQQWVAAFHHFIVM